MQSLGRILIILGFCSVGCSGKSTGPVANGNLLANGSFERNGVPTLEGWLPGNSELAEITNEAAPGGGEYALQLQADWAPTSGFVTTPVTGVHDRDIVRVSAYVRAVVSGGGGAVSVEAGPSRNKRPTHWKSVRATETEWTLVTIVDTLSLNENDSVWVRLSSFDTEVESLIGDFDLVSLSLVESR